MATATNNALQPFSYEISANGRLPKDSRAEVQLTYQTSASGIVCSATTAQKFTEIKQKGMTSCQGGRIQGELFPNTQPTMRILFQSPNGTSKAIPLQFGETTKTELAFPERPSAYFADRGVSTVSIRFETGADSVPTQARVEFGVQMSVVEGVYHGAADFGDSVTDTATRAAQSARSTLGSWGSAVTARLPAMPRMPSWSGTSKADNKKE